MTRLKLPPPSEKTDPFFAVTPRPPEPEPDYRLRKPKPRERDKDGKIIKKLRVLSHKEGGNRKPNPKYHVASPEMRTTIANMAGYGLDVLTISKLAGISPPTIYKHYSHEMKTAAAKKDLMVLQGAFLRAVGGPQQDWEKSDPAMQRWWIERRQGWAPPPTRIINERMDLTKLSDRQLDDLERIMEAAAVESGRDQEGENEPDI